MTKHYDLYKEDTYVGTFTLIQISRQLMEGQDTVREHAVTGLPLGTYRIINARTAESENAKKRILTEWDGVRFRLNPKARKE